MEEIRLSLQMKQTLIAAVVMICFLLILIFVVTLFKRPKMPYEAKPILTRREYQFYRLLAAEARRRGLLVCPKVGLKDLLQVSCKKDYMTYFHKIAQKHVDFVICDRELNVLFAVELDDSSHDTKEARQKDRFKDQAFHAAGILLLRVRQYDERTVQDLFRIRRD